MSITLTDLFENVPEENPYSTLKLRLLKKYTDLEKAEMVPSLPGLGDRKPSSLMDIMLALCPSGQETPPLYLNELLCKMPVVVRGHLHTFSHKDPLPFHNTKILCPSTTRRSGVVLPCSTHCAPSLV